MDKHRDGENGFTLIEVLCAASIAAFAIAGLYASLTTSLRATDRLDGHMGARITARSVLAELDNEPRDILRNRHGTSGEYNWDLQVEPASGDLARISPPGFQLYDLKLTVFWAPQGHIEINSVRMRQ